MCLGPALPIAQTTCQTLKESGPAQSSLVDFSVVCDSLEPGVLTHISCVGLLNSFELPSPLRNFCSIRGPLGALRLYSDLVREDLYLWHRSRPAVLVVGRSGCSSANAVVRLAPWRMKLSDTIVLSNFPLCE